MDIATIAVPGSGVIGGSWAIVYARAGLSVTLYERDTGRRPQVRDRLRRTIADSADLLRPDDDVETVLGRITVCDDLVTTVDGADLVHECIEEKLESKRAIFAELDRIARPDAILASATSSFPTTQLAGELEGRARCIVIHPATPPHLLPITEICPAPFTEDRVTDASMELMRRCGQAPVHILKEIDGFVLNRMQAALVVEMLTLVRDGVISPADVDTIISQGFGLRWAFLGPLEGVDLNATGGIRQYLENFGFLFNDKAADFGQGPVITDDTIAMLEDYARGRVSLDALPDKIAWRDKAIMELRALKAESGSADDR